MGRGVVCGEEDRWNYKILPHVETRVGEDSPISGCVLQVAVVFVICLVNTVTKV